MMVNSRSVLENNFDTNSYTQEEYFMLMEYLECNSITVCSDYIGESIYEGVNVCVKDEASMIMSGAKYN